MSTIFKIMRYVLMDVLRNRWVIGYALFFLAITDVLLRLGGSGPRALLSLLNVVVLLIPLVSIVFGTIYWHGAREFNELLLSQPVARTTLFHGLFAGLVIPLSVAFVVGVSIPVLVHRATDVDTLPLLTLMLLAGCALTAVFSALAVLIAGLVDDRLKGLGIALAVWLLMTVAYDGLVLWVAMVFQDYPLEGPMLALSFANPVDLARVLLVLRFDVSALMGYTGAVMQRIMGSPLGMAAAFGGLALWTLAPGLLALRAFKRRDF
ncbi:MAG: ABC transporter permease subunit [Gemmatimonadaceae bacterium]